MKNHGEKPKQTKSRRNPTNFKAKPKAEENRSFSKLIHTQVEHIYICMYVFMYVCMYV